jgi:hypothetical protein
MTQVDDLIKLPESPTKVILLYYSKNCQVGVFLYSRFISERFSRALLFFSFFAIIVAMQGHGFVLST